MARWQVGRQKGGEYEVRDYIDGVVFMPSFFAVLSVLLLIVLCCQCCVVLCVLLQYKVVGLQNPIQTYMLLVL